MKVRELFTEDYAERYGDMDIVDDVCEELWECFCPPTLLTEEGEKEFALVLDDEVIDGGDVLSYHIDHLPEGVWQKHLRVMTRLIHSVAGYCADEDWNKWFYYPDEGKFYTVSIKADGGTLMSWQYKTIGEAREAMRGLSIVMEGDEDE